MSKKFDIAQQNPLDQVQVTLWDFNIPSLSEYGECGNEIPIERQRYDSITLCIEYKNKQEQHKKMLLNDNFLHCSFCIKSHCFMDDLGLSIYSYANAVKKRAQYDWTLYW